MARSWKCRGCGTTNPRLAQKCRGDGCTRSRPKPRKPAHTVALEQPYEAYVTLNGGERCGICGKPPSGSRRLDRDHDHKTGEPRGLLCGGRMGCNRKLGRIDDPVWLENALAYVRRRAALPAKEAA